jgi:hypothetical protein
LIHPLIRQKPDGLAIGLALRRSRRRPC